MSIKFSSLSDKEKAVLSTGWPAGQWILSALKMRESGSTLKEISNSVGRSPERVRQCLETAAFRLRKFRDPLSARTLNCLCQGGILPVGIDFQELQPNEIESIKEEIRKAIQSDFARFSALKNYALKSHKELCAWIGIPGDPKLSQVPFIAAKARRRL